MLDDVSCEIREIELSCLPYHVVTSKKQSNQPTHHLGRRKPNPHET
jgi:hypothetical protein